MSNKRLTFRQKHERILEIILCVLHKELLPTELIDILCVSIIFVWKEDEDRCDQKNGFVKYCCCVDPFAYEEFWLTCSRNNTILAGAACNPCKKWICNDHQDTHKFCFCGNQLFRDKTHETNSKEFDAKEIIMQLFQVTDKKELEWLKESDVRELIQRTIQETTIEVNRIFCCHVDNNYWYSPGNQKRCFNNATKFCFECEQGFCSDHLEGFCRCGKPISLKALKS